MTAVIVKEPIADYEARRSTFLTSHRLKDFMDGPEAFNGPPKPRKPKAHYAEGGAIHCAVLEGPLTYRQRYFLGGPVNPTTGKSYGLTSQRFQKWAAEKEPELAAKGWPATCITPETNTLVDKVFNAVWSDPRCVRLLEGSTPEVSVIGTYGEIETQSRLDAWKPAELILDLKTVDDMGRFSMQVEAYGYRHQMAFYRSMVRRVTGDTLPCHLIAVEKRAPCRVEVRELTDHELGEAERENDAAVRCLTRCRLTGVWPKTFNLHEELWK